MTKRRKLSKYEQECAERLFSIFEAKKDGLGLTQEAAADRLGFKNQSALNHYLKARQPMNTDFKLAIARLLEIKVTDFDPEFKADPNPAPTGGLVGSMLSPGQAFVVDSIKDFDQDKIFKVVQAIGHIKDGKDVAPVQDQPQKPLFKDLMRQFMESAGPEEINDLRGLLAGQLRSEDGTDANKEKTSSK